jgi:hypothetical protein
MNPILQVFVIRSGDLIVVPVAKSMTAMNLIQAYEFQS